MYIRMVNMSRTSRCLYPLVICMDSIKLHVLAANAS